MFDGVIENICSLYLTTDEDKENWNLAGLREYLLGWVTEKGDLNYTDEQLKDISCSDIVAQLTEKAKAKYAAREKEWGEPITRDLERQVLLRNVDLNWMDHIDAMDELRRGISLRSYAQHDPVIEYRVEGSDMYDAMVATIRENTVKMLLTVKVRIGVKIEREQVAKPYEPVPDGTDKKSMQRSSKKVGRNDPCPCGSGKKYKHCCGR